jgi:fumarylacetoacetase
MIDHTHDPALTSWIESANLPDTDFPIQNLPFATFHRPGADALRVGVAIGDQVLDASAAFDVRSLRGLMAQSREQRLALRHRISSFLSKYSNRPDRFLVPQNEVTLLLPCEIRDYTDFYASIDHATNVGRMLRPDQPLLPNYKWIPIGYHGRASSIVVSGSPVVRPLGQLMEAGAAQPRYAPTRRLDYEVEIGAWSRRRSLVWCVSSE